MPQNIVAKFFEIPPDQIVPAVQDILIDRIGFQVTSPYDPDVNNFISKDYEKAPDSNKEGFWKFFLFCAFLLIFMFALDSSGNHQKSSPSSPPPTTKVETQITVMLKRQFKKIWLDDNKQGGFDDRLLIIER